MHPLKHPRNILVIGGACAVVAAIYALPGIVDIGYRPEWAGVTMLFALGIAMSLMFYVLIAGSSKD